ncbi:MAG: tetratricopeptide repeat protein [Bythopirellula sp.]
MERSIHDHKFLGANTALPYWQNDPESIRAHQEFLTDSVRVDIFGLREGGRLEGELNAPLRPKVPALEPGKSYLLETVIRTLTLGHHFTQGTTDSNEIWLQLRITDANGQLIAESGTISADGQVDPWAYFVNTFMLDREGNRISRRNAQDIFVPLYSHQIPPGAAQTIHYRLDVPENARASLAVEARLFYRKFDQSYVDYIVKQHPADGPPLANWRVGQEVVNSLPITTLASDRIKFAVSENPESTSNHPASEIPTWQRWNDFGIGSLLKGTAELRQAEAAFEQVEKLGRFDGPLNLARVYFREGRLDEAVAAVERSTRHDDPAAPPWTVAWLSGLINRQQGHLDEAEVSFRSVLSPPNSEMRRRGFDFRKDYVVRNLLGQTLFDRARRIRGAEKQSAREQLLGAALDEFKKTLVLDPENADAHYNLQLLYGASRNEEMESHHRKLHLKYKPDDNARDLAVAAARKKYPAANQAAEAVVIYELRPVSDTE